MNIPLFSLFITLTAQTATGSMPATPASFDRPVIAVTGKGTSRALFSATDFQITIYADTAAATESEAKALAEKMRKEIIKAVKELGGGENDVVLVNLNNIAPMETDPLYRINQDLQVTLKNVKSIDKVKEKFLLLGKGQVGSVTPLIDDRDTVDFGPAVSEARASALSSARDEASALAAALGVILGEPVYASEQVIYPYGDAGGYDAYAGAYGTENAVTVLVTVYYLMIYKK